MNWYRFNKKGIGIFYQLTILVLYTFVNCTSSSSLSVQKTTCEYQESPFLVNSKTPRFGWQIFSDRNQVEQSAYSIEIADAENNIIWNTGRVKSNQSQHVEYSGENVLVSGKEYFWRVKIWDENNKSSGWSKISTFRMAPSNIEENVKWIGAITKKESNLPEGRNFHTPAISSDDRNKWQQTNPLSKRSIYLRKDFSSNKSIKEAIIYISGLGHYELSLNGNRISDEQFNPMWSDYDKTVYYNGYNVTKYLKENNSFGVLLGNGFYNEQGGRYTKMQVSFGPPTLFLKMFITYEDGTSQEIVSDESWKYSPGPLVFNDMYGGEDYDAQLEQEGWDSFGFDDSLWLPVVIQESPEGTLTPQGTAPIKIMEKFSAQNVKRINDSYVFDMEQNLSGYPMIKVRGKKGDSIKLILGERLMENGLVDQRQSGAPYYYVYTLKGDGEEIWHPRFSYYGYRYIQVEGAKPNNAEDSRDIPVLLDIQSFFVHNSSRQVGSFRCSNDIFNEAHKIIVNAIKSNMQSVFTDCPHREKLGWLEQTHLNGPGLFYNFDLTTFMPKVMQDIRDAQLFNGLVPDIAPEYVVFKGGFRDSPEWGSASVILPMMYYEYYGDKSLIVNYYDVMKRYVDYLSTTAKNHIVSHGLGDWCDYNIDQPYGVSQNTPVPLSASAHYYMAIDHLVKAAEIVKESEDVIIYSDLREKVKQAFNKEFFDKETKQYGTGSQASNSMPLFAGIVMPEYKQAVLNNLVKNIEERGYRLSTGNPGNRYLFQALAQNGLNEIMFKMFNHEEVPGYGFQLKFGATTLTELWDPREGASWNHFMMGQIEEWFYKSLAGINFDKTHNDGFKTIIISPQPVGDLSFVEASYETLYGKISVDWKIENNTFTLNVIVPGNCTAKVYLPREDVFKEIGSGEYTFTKVLK